MRGRGEQVLRKLALALAATSLIVAGCGGGSGGDNNNPPPPPNTGGSFVKLPQNPGQVSFSFLTGAGRAPGDMTAVIRRAVLSDSFGEVETILNPERTLQLNGYTHQIVDLIVPTLNSRFFQNYTLEVKEIRLDNGSPFPDVFPSGSTEPLVRMDFPASIRVLPGRVTSVAVRLDDTMFDLNAQDPDPIFQQDLWEEANLAENPVQGIDTLNGSLSDYIMFDLSGIPSGNRPVMPGASVPAGKIYFSGDFVALSTGGSSGTYEVLTAQGFVNGTFAPVVNLPSPGSQKPPFGTYTLLQSDPRDDDPSDNDFPGPTAAQITALVGTYYNLADVVGGLTTFEMIAFPRSNEREVFDSNNDPFLRELSVQDIVIIRRSGNTIVEMYFGEIDYGDTLGDPAVIRAYPIGQVDDGDAFNEIEGTVSGFKDVSGNAMSIAFADDAFRAQQIQKIGSGTFTLQSGTDPIYGGALPGNFATTGRFLVFRR